MKKLTEIVILAVIIVMAMYSFALAVEQKEYQKLFAEKCELLVKLVECEIAKLDLEKNYLDFQLLTLEYFVSESDLKDATKSEKTKLKVKIIKERMEDLRKRRIEAFKLLGQAKEILSKAMDSL